MQRAVSNASATASQATSGLQGILQQAQASLVARGIAAAQASIGDNGTDAAVARVVGAPTSSVVAINRIMTLLFSQDLIDMIDSVSKTMVGSFFKCVRQTLAVLYVRLLNLQVTACIAAVAVGIFVVIICWWLMARTYLQQLSAVSYNLACI